MPNETGKRGDRKKKRERAPEGLRGITERKGQKNPLSGRHPERHHREGKRRYEKSCGERERRALLNGHRKDSIKKSKRKG